jgi:hypothetical protein
MIISKLLQIPRRHLRPTDNLIVTHLAGWRRGEIALFMTGITVEFLMVLR